MSEQKFFAVEDGVLPRFYQKSVENKFKSAAEGRPIFENVEWVEIIIPGDKRTVVSQRVRPDHRIRFKNVYKAFKEGSIIDNMGTPIGKMQGVDPATEATLKYLNIHTIEALAQLPDSVLPNLGMGARELREKAIRYVNETNVDEATSELRKQNADLLARLEALESKQGNGSPERREKKRGQERDAEAEKAQEYNSNADDLPPFMQGK